MTSKKERELMRENDREFRHTERQLQRDRQQLERQEKQLESDIRKAAKQGNKQAATTLAKQLIQLRNQKTKSMAMSGKMTALNHQTKTMATTAKMAETMGATAKTMAKVNDQFDPVKVQKTMQDFERESTKMEMSEEMMTDTLDSVLAGSDDETETDAVVANILDEIGIEMTGKLAAAPVGVPDAGKKDITDADIERMLTQLKS